jgi:hypothetical protein
VADLDLTQAEADFLLAMEKLSESPETMDFPVPGERIEIPLVSSNKRERFFLDMSRSELVIAKGTYQNRARQVIVLARLDSGGKPHRNPDDEEVPVPHLHLYRQGFGDKWAFPVPEEKFRDVSSPQTSFEDFMGFCNITKPPSIQWGIA